MSAAALTPRELTPRELEILRLFRDGLVPKEVATELGVTLRTVKTHAENIHRKLRVTNRTAAVVEALRQGVIALHRE